MIATSRIQPEQLPHSHMSVSDQHHQQQSQHQFGQAGIASAPFQITSTYIPSYQTAQIPSSTTSSSSTSSSSSAPSYPTMLSSYTATQQSPANNPAQPQTYGAQYSHYLQQQQQQQQQHQQHQQQTLEPLPSIFVTQNQSRVPHQANETLYPAYYGTGISTGTNSSTNAISTVSNAAAPSTNSGSGTSITYSAVPSYSPYMQLGDNGQYSTTAPLPSTSTSSSSTSASSSSSYSYQQINPYSTSLAPGYNAVHTNSHQPQMHSSSQRYPASPASMSDKTSISSVASTASMPPLPQPHLYASNTTTMMAPPMPSQPQPQQQHHQSSLTSSTNLQYAPSANTKGEEIDYSSIVSYTISPSLKRKRRQKKSNLVTPSSSLSLSSSASSSILDPLNRTETYPCPQCDKVFQKPYNLKSHMKTHSTEKPFQCSYCPKTFARSHDKKRHEVLHKGTKNFKCEGYLQDGKTRWGCGKRFARSDALSRHFRTETGWLCIRPLMDEAKRLEEQGFQTNLSKNQSISSSGAGVAGLPRLDEYASGLSQMHQHSQLYTNQQHQQGNNSGEHNDETYDNSQLIRKMIYNK